jgi:hypothetical protein
MNEFESIKIKKYRVIFVLLIIASLSLISYSCGDCDLTSTESTIFTCYNGNIDEFDPRLSVDTTGGTKTIVGVPEYSIGSFLFPNDMSATGIIANENFGMGLFFGVYEQYAPPRLEFSSGNNNYVAVIDNYYPTNPNLKGDILVDSVDMSGTRLAIIRVAGSITQFSGTINTDDCSAFRTFLDNYRSFNNDLKYDNIRSQLKQYGEGLTNANVTSTTNILVFNKANGLWASETPPSNISEELLKPKNSKSVTLTVRRGEVYYYRAKNGKEFALFITDINEGSLPPFKRRIAIKYSALRGISSTECPKQ